MAFEGAVVTNLHLKPRQGVRVKGFIAEDCKVFSINLGKDANSFAVHCNPRFDHCGDIKKLILNSLQDGVWGAELKKDAFPFQQGAETSVFFRYLEDNIIVCLSSGEQFTFPLRFPSEEISYVSLVGLQLTSLSVE
ncbi:galectin-1-like [Hyperolius riggenbachi]|uniref:galectin-1-like n=1 Tax=Hyperolius riggenbachi TaxID=752182 RepID=UPI0035A2AF51